MGRVLDVLHCNIKRYENHWVFHIARHDEDEPAEKHDTTKKKEDVSSA